MKSRGKKNSTNVGYFDTPLLRYIGGKWRLAEWIADQFPMHECYVEPYCGASSVFFRKQPSSIEVINDMNGELINFFRVLRDRRDDLVAALDLTPFSREEYDRAYEPIEDELESARRFYIRSWQSFSGHAGHKTGWRHQRSKHDWGTDIVREWQRRDGLLRSAARLLDAQIEHDQAINIIARFDTPRTLFYLDPPYVLKTRSGSHKRYVFEMTDDDHRALSECLHQIKGMAILSGYDGELYQRLYTDWFKIQKSTTTNGNSVATESLWLSQNATRAQTPLFNYAGASEDDRDA